MYIWCILYQYHYLKCIFLAGGQTKEKYGFLTEDSCENNWSELLHTKRKWQWSFRKLMNVTIFSGCIFLTERYPKSCKMLNSNPSYQECHFRPFICDRKHSSTWKIVDFSRWILFPSCCRCFFSMTNRSQWQQFNGPALDISKHEGGEWWDSGILLMAV